MPTVLHKSFLPEKTKGREVLQVPPAWKTRTDPGYKEVRGKESRKRKRGKSDEANGTDDSSSFKEMWEKSVQQENKRFEKSMKMFQENQKMQLEQTESLLTGLKDLLKDLVKE